MNIILKYIIILYYICYNKLHTYCISIPYICTYYLNIICNKYLFNFTLQHVPSFSGEIISVSCISTNKSFPYEMMVSYAGILAFFMDGFREPRLVRVLQGKAFA